MEYTNSPLVSCTKLSPNHSGQRTHAIDRITPHCVVGQLSAEAIGNTFASTVKQASCNYGIGVDGQVVMCCEEKNRSWCSSSRENDQRAVTIECASDVSHPYAFNSIVYDKLIELCVDICKRNGKKKLLWFGNKTNALKYKPKSDEMVITVHRWFANKSCPGDWLYNRLGDVAAKVTSKLNDKPTSDSNVAKVNVGPHDMLELYKVKVSINDLFIRSGPGTNYASSGFCPTGVYTIVEESDGVGATKWGKLKSGAGWISLDYAKRI